MGKMTDAEREKDAKESYEKFSYEDFEKKVSATPNADCFFVSFGYYNCLWSRAQYDDKFAMMEDRQNIGFKILTYNGKPILPVEKQNLTTFPSEVAKALGFQKLNWVEITV